MTRPPRRTSGDVMQRISIALDTMTSDPQAPRTKREIERRTQLSHDAVARAFRHDAAGPSQWNLTNRFAELGERPTRRSDPQARQIRELETKIKDKNKQITQLKAALDRHAMTVLAMHLQLQQLPSPSSNIVAIGRNRRPGDLPEPAAASSGEPAHQHTTPWNTIVTHPASDHDTIKITLSSSQIHEVISLLIEVHGVPDNLYPDGTQPEITSTAQAWLQTTGSSYTLPTMIDAVDSLTTQLTYHKRHTINAAAANTTTARNDTEPACF